MTTNTALRYRRFGDPDAVLTLETEAVPERPKGMVRVRMLLAPVNPSDLIPITGAYAHRVQPPQVAGYEGVGIVLDADKQLETLVGSRVLPLRGSGTWQQIVDVAPEWIVPVPPSVRTQVAAQAYINPLAAWLMLRRWSPTGKHVLLTAAGSACAGLLAQWSLTAGARKVTAVYRSREHAPRLAERGTTPICQDDAEAVARAASDANVVFEAVGGELGTMLLRNTPQAGELISYGLLSGRQLASVGGKRLLHRFHLRDAINDVDPQRWQKWFRELWPLLAGARFPRAAAFPVERWRDALAYFKLAGRAEKPMLQFKE